MTAVIKQKHGPWSDMPGNPPGGDRSGEDPAVVKRVLPIPVDDPGRASPQPPFTPLAMRSPISGSMFRQYSKARSSTGPETPPFR